MVPLGFARRLTVVGTELSNRGIVGVGAFIWKYVCLGCVGKCSSVLYALLVRTYVSLFLSANKYVHNRQHIHNLHVISIGGIYPLK